LPGYAITLMKTTISVSCPTMCCILSSLDTLPPRHLSRRLFVQAINVLARLKPILIDVALDTWGRSIPNAIGLQGTGQGTGFSEAVQSRLRRKMQNLTNGDLSAPIVVFGVNSERFTGYNLALRLVALGYTQIYWYRGGVEAWQVNGLPETDLALQDW
jgi:adenylate cyclase